MAVVLVRQYPTQELTGMDKGKIVGRKMFYVKVDSNTDPEDIILSHPDVPNKGASYSASFPGVRAKQIKVMSSRSVDDNAFHWDVIVDYDNDYDSSKDIENPLLEPARISISNEYRDKIIYQDVENGNDIKNSGEEPTPFVTRISYPRISWKKNIAVFDYGLLDLVGSVNSAAVTIDGEDYDKETAFLSSLDVSDYREKNGIVYREMSVVVLISSFDEGWKRKLMNQSKRMKGENGEFKPIPLPKSSAHVSSPWPLDKQGAPLPADAGPKQFSYEEWNEYKLKDWSGIGLS